METAPTYWLRGTGDGDGQPPTAFPGRVGVLVVGGGLMGVASAYWLARRGLDVLVCEARSLGYGASGRNIGVVLPAPRATEDCALLAEVLREERVDAAYQEAGHLTLASSAPVWDRVRAEVARRPTGAAPLHALTRPECEDLLGMRINRRFAGGRWATDGRGVDPVRLVDGLGRAAREHGAAIATGTRVRTVAPVRGNGRLAADTSRGRVIADAVVLACHLDIGRFVPSLAGTLTPARGQVMATAPARQVFPFGMAVDWGSVYWRQAGDGTILVGGCRQVDPDREKSARALVNPRIQCHLDGFLPDAFPDLPPLRTSQRWAGVMDCTPDGRPVVGQAAGQADRWVIGGFGGHGIPPALATARALAEAVATGTDQELLAPFAPDRFQTSDQP
ncbi:FAD-binding oxidoreductase [Micromonospora sp. NPDC051296]|uniref:NAD(P)/FAD-dependent oxidoreductase n=1 Tax=Micromonospora sp. NPDC051296 TaxID=3155046 RepID=UPI00343914EA